MESPYQINYETFSDWRTAAIRPPERTFFARLRLFAGEYLLTLLLPAGAVTLVNPFNWLSFAPSPGSNGWWGLLALVALGAVYLRRRIIRHPALADYACPDCHSPHLARIPRRFRHRLLGLAQIPAHRYLCSQCEWKGLRIDR